MLIETSPFKSFWMGGFEGADHINAQHEKLDMLEMSGHLQNIDSDYAKLKELGIFVVRESLGWRKTEGNFSRIEKIITAAEKHGIQVIWTFMHYGVPDGVCLLDDLFIDELIAFSLEVDMYIRSFTKAPQIYNIVNEISFLAWAISQTDFIYPYKNINNSHVGFEIKRRLVKATIKAMNEILQINPTARFIHVEPLIHCAPQHKSNETLAKEITSYQWQVFDMLSGKMCPEIGGSPYHLDLIGVNHYYNSQFEIFSDAPLSWNPPDDRRKKFSTLLKEVHDKYDRPIIITETSHINEDKATWLEYISKEVEEAIQMHLPILGMCIYPMADRTCWHEPKKWINCGLIEVKDNFRSLNHQYTNILRRWQERLPK